MMSFQEIAKLGLELLSKQSPITLAKARSQAQKLRTQSTTNNKKQRDQNCLSQKNNLWVENIDFSQYVSEAAEQKVFLKNSKQVIKLNDGIYYNCWRDYFYNLLLHNYFFEDTAYELIGFVKENGGLYAVVQQTFVSITENTKIENVKSFLNENGFQNTRNNDYYNPNLGIILEDLHDENVLTKNDVLYFIDTVFYLTENFWIET